MSTLLERIVAARCAVRGCDNERAPDAQVCRPHLNDLLMHRLDRAEDGSYIPRRIFVARDDTGWVKAA